MFIITASVTVKSPQCNQLEGVTQVEGTYKGATPGRINAAARFIL